MIQSQTQQMQFQPHQLVIVRAADRSSTGFSGSYRGGRFWPSAHETVVEVWDTEECPKVDNPGKPGTSMLDPNRIGLAAWRMIERDTTLALRLAPVGSKLETTVRKTAAQLEAENAALRDNVIDLTDRLGGVEQENESLTLRLGSLEQQVRQLLAPAPTAPDDEDPETDDDASAEDDDGVAARAETAAAKAADKKAKADAKAAAKVAKAAKAKPDLADARNTNEG